MKYISDEELLSCGTAPGACWVAIDGDVLDISPFMDHHPGGPEIIVHLRGRDASQEFADVGHSPEARNMLRQFVVVRRRARCPARTLRRHARPFRRAHRHVIGVCAQGKLQAVPRMGVSPRSSLLAAAAWLQPRAPFGRSARSAVATTVAAVLAAATCWLVWPRLWARRVRMRGD